MGFAWYDKQVESSHPSFSYPWSLQGLEAARLTKKQNGLCEEYVKRALANGFKEHRGIHCEVLRLAVTELRGTEREGELPVSTRVWKVRLNRNVTTPQYATRVEHMTGFADNHVKNALKRMLKRGDVKKVTMTSGEVRFVLTSEWHKEEHAELRARKEHNTEKVEAVDFLRQMFGRWGLDPSDIQNYPLSGIQISLSAEDTCTLAKLLRKLST